MLVAAKLFSFFFFFFSNQEVGGSKGRPAGKGKGRFSALRCAKSSNEANAASKVSPIAVNSFMFQEGGSQVPCRQRVRIAVGVTAATV